MAEFETNEPAEGGTENFLILRTKWSEAIRKSGTCASAFGSNRVLLKQWLKEEFSQATESREWHQGC
jgi:hypothetical protein